MRKLIVALALVALAGLTPVPVLADHANRAVCTDGTYTCGHWGNRYSPPVYTNLAGWQTVSGASVVDIIQDAGYFWQDNGFVQGWNPGAFPAQGGPNCTGQVAGFSFIDGAIHVCFVPSSDSHLNGRAESTSVTRFGRCDTACNHIYAATMWIATDASPPLRQYAIRHGLGHALGLGHHNSECGVMNSLSGCPSATQDDRNAMWIEYGSHVSG
jgi:hypothetical protein